MPARNRQHLSIDQGGFADLFLDPAQRGVEPRAGQIGHARMKVKAIDETRRQIHFLCSTGEIDRYSEIVEPSAFAESIEAFLLNGVFPAGHVYVGASGEPTVIGHWVKVWISKDGLEGIAEFDDEDPLAVRYWNLYRKGHMKAVSVGFIARAWEMRGMEIEGQTRTVRVFTKVELLEISAVAIPANRAALMRAAGFAPAPGAPADDDSAGAASPDDIDARMEAAVERALDRVLQARQVSLTSSGPDVAAGPDYFALDLDDDDIPTDDDVPDASAALEGDDDSQIKSALLAACEALGA